MLGLYFGGLGVVYNDNPIEILMETVDNEAENIISNMLKGKTEDGNINIVCPVFLLNKYNKYCKYDNIFDNSEDIQMRHVLFYIINNQEEGLFGLYMTIFSPSSDKNRLSFRIEKSIYELISKNKSEIIEKALFLFFVNRMEVKKNYKSFNFGIPTHDDILLYKNNQFSFLEIEKLHLRKRKDDGLQSLVDVKINKFIGTWLTKYSKDNNVSKTEVIKEALNNIL